MSMSTDRAKQVAYDLTMEYFKQNELFKGDIKSIPAITTHFEEVYNLMLHNIEFKKIH